MMALGVLGGSGIYTIEELSVLAEHEVDTPYGRPSSPIVEGILQHPKNPMGQEETRLLFLARHGRSHHIPPHQINYRANICALRMLGARQLLSVSAVGSLREDIVPGDVVVIDQYIDWTKGRLNTYFDEGVVAHVSLADPVCPHLHQAVLHAVEAAQQVSETEFDVHSTGTYLCMQGPQFSTRAESLLYQSWGADVIGMTAATEAKLAREAELPYATLALSTDYDCWRNDGGDVTVESVLAVLRANSSLAQTIVALLPSYLTHPQLSPASTALKHALISHGPHAEYVKDQLSWLLPTLK